MKILNASAAVFAALLLALSATGCESTDIEPATPEDCKPVAVVQIKVNNDLAFYGYRKAQNTAQSAASKAVGGGVLGKLASSAVKTVSKSSETLSFLYAEGLTDTIKQIVFEELSSVPEVLEVIPAEQVTSSKSYAAIKSEKTDYYVVPDGFKYLGPSGKDGAKKRAEAEQAVRQDLGAKGYAYVTVDLSHSIDDKTEIAGTVSGSLHAYAKVTISIVDENGRPLTHKNKSGTVVKYRFGGAASEETVPMVADVYDGQALYDLYPSAIRAAIRNSLKD